MVDNFNLLYSQSVKRAFGYIQIFGLDLERISPKLALDISYISLRAGELIAGSVEPEALGEDIGDDTVEARDLHAEEVLIHTRRALILGHAGSGKTTLLQWLCTKVVEKSLSGRLSPLNSHTPFFIRLRDFYQRTLPLGDELISCASRALTSQVPEGWIANILDSGLGLFFIDGLDEISNAQRSR